MTKSNAFLADHAINNEFSRLLFKYKHEMIFMNTKISNTKETHKFIIYLSQRLDIRSSSKHVTLQNLPTKCTCNKNIRQQYINIKMRVIDPVKYIKIKREQFKMMNLNYLMVLIQCRILRIIPSIL